MEPTNKEMAEFYRLALSSGAARPEEVIAWADAAIENAESAPPWAIDLALASRGTDLVTLLGAVPGEVLDRRPGLLLLGRLATPRKKGALSGRHIARLLFSLFLSDVLPPETESDVFGVDEGLDLEETGVWSTAQAEEALDAFLGRFASYDPTQLGA